MKRILAIRTGDREYAEELAKNFNRCEEFPFQTLIFTDEDVYSSYIKDNRIDVLLCDEELLNECEKNVGEAVVCGLSEILTVNDPAGENTAIFKYQSSETIMKEILARYRMVIGKKESHSGIDRKTTKVYSVCSPVGGSYSSTFSLALAMYLSKRCNTLFMSFDPFFILPESEKDPAEKDLTDVIFYLNGMQSYLMEFIKKLTTKVGRLECISGVSHWFDLYDMSTENMHDLIEIICNSNCYDSIVFDIGIIGAASMEVLLSSDRIYVPLKHDISSEKKVKEWKRQLRYCGREELLERVINVEIPEDDGLKGEYGYDALLSGKLGSFLEGGVEI